jgi:hypothetical protein
MSGVGRLQKGDPDMTSIRGPWVWYLLAGTSIALAPMGLRSARAQGFSPDPFQPFNSQFQQYVRPISPFAGGPGAAGPMGRADNQYQQYLKELEGADRAQSQRYGIGVQYWKLRSDAALDKRDQAKRGIGRRREVAAESISQKYLAYFSEENPKKRATLMREFTTNPRQELRGGLAGAEDEAENGEGGPDAGRRPRREAGGLSGTGGRAGAASSRDSAKSGDATSGRTPAAPPPPRGRFPTGAGRSPSRKPTDVLDRSRRIDDEIPSPRKPGRRNSDEPAPSSPDN